MIVWCSECKTAPIELPEESVTSITDSWCAECWYADYPRRALFGPYEEPEWFAPGEFNTVNLKKLREEWQDRRYNMPLEGWQRLKDQLKHLF